MEAHRRDIRETQQAAIVAGILVVLVGAIALAWAKWIPYEATLAESFAAGTYESEAILTSAAGQAPSLAAGWEFLGVYSSAIWKALVAALVFSAAIEALVPSSWLTRILTAGGRTRTVAAGLAATPSMMCTCCTTPLVRTFRSRGVDNAPALAYWIGNPLLNPAVIAFLALALPWQWVTTRVVVGAAIVFGATLLAARLATRPVASAPVGAPESQPGDESLRGAPRRFAFALGRFSVTLVPEYLIVVLLVGIFGGWLLPIGAWAGEQVVLATLAAAVLGTLFVIPTAAEIPIIVGLLGVGAGSGPLGALLIALPAISLPSMVMVAGAIETRVVAAMAGFVAAGAVAAGVLLAALGG